MATASETNVRRTRDGFLIGRIAGIPVFVAPSWAIIAILITVLFAPSVGFHIPEIGSGRFAVSATYAVLLYASVLIHELGHALLAKYYGVGVRKITLQLLGGVTEMDREANSPRREFAVAAAGPALSLLLGLVAWLSIRAMGADPGGLGGASAAGDPTDSVTRRIVLELLDALMYANIAVGLFNLLPGLPLDGGVMLRSALWGATGRPHTAAIAAGWVGRVLAVVVFFIPPGLDAAGDGEISIISVVWGALLGGFIYAGASAALRSARIRQRLPMLSARTLAHAAIAVPADLPLSEALIRAARGSGPLAALVVVDTGGRPIGLVNAASAAATPEQRRPWVSVATLSRRLEPALHVDVELTGEALLARLSEHPSTEYLVLEADGAIHGVLRSTDVEAALGV